MYRFLGVSLGGFGPRGSGKRTTRSVWTNGFGRRAHHAKPKPPQIRVSATSKNVFLKILPKKMIVSFWSLVQPKGGAVWRTQKAAK